MRRTTRKGKTVRTKKQLGKKAALKTLKRYCFEVWTELVKARDGHKCVLCGATKYVQAHHIITRKYAPTRFDLNCGISLCAKCHELGLVSVNTAPWVLYDWLATNRPEQYAWFLQKREGIFVPQKSPDTVADYSEILQRLLATFESMFPQGVKSRKYTKFLKKQEEI